MGVTQMLVDFSERLKRLRREKGYSQAALAQKVSDMGQNLSEAALAKIRKQPNVPQLAGGRLSCGLFWRFH